MVLKKILYFDVFSYIKYPLTANYAAKKLIPKQTFFKF